MIKPELKRLCLGCMAELEGKGPCRLCGYTETGPVNADYLAPGVILNKRYLIGKLLSSNGESAVYIGYDAEEDVKVFVREFMPGKLVTRNHASMSLKPIAGYETVYKNLLAEFEDLCSILKGMEIRGISQILQIIEGNNTAYAVFRYQSVMTLGDFITQCGGEIQWSRFKKIYLALLNTLSQIHQKGLIHAGISPQTVLIDEKGNPFLSGFSINALRSRETELECELFDGYSAPEQYENRGRYGNWTDIYAISAILYRTITGTMPPSASDRYLHDNLIDAAGLDANIPQNVSDAIHNGMLLPIDCRTQSADDLSAQLLDNVETNTTVYRTDPPVELTAKEQRRLAKQTARELRRLEKETRRKPHTALSIFLSMLFTSALLGTFLWVFLQKYPIQDGTSSSLPVSSEESRGETSPTEDTAVPEFVGQYVDSITTNSDYVSRYDFETEYDYSDLYANGVVFYQLPVSGTLMPNRGTVILQVSKGRDTVPMPNLVGSTTELATQTLIDLELPFEIIEVDNDSYQEGVIGMMIPEAGSNVRHTDKSLVVMLYTRKSASADKAPSPSKEESASSESSSNPYKSSKPAEPSKPTARKRDPNKQSSSSKDSWRD